MNNGTKLLPCPFCGGEAEGIDFFPRFFVKCKNCGVNTGFYSNISNAIEAWNTRNYLEKQDSLNSSEIPNCSIGEKIIDAIIENKLFSVINPRTNKEIKETLVVWAGNANEIIETVVCEQSCKKSYKEENVTLKLFVPKWKNHYNGYYYLKVPITQTESLRFLIDYTDDSSNFVYICECGISRWDDDCDDVEEIGEFYDIKDAKAKVNEIIKEFGEKLVYYSEHIKTEE